jgi:hypothetical protein
MRRSECRTVVWPAIIEETPGGSACVGPGWRPQARRFFARRLEARLSPHGRARGASASRPDPAASLLKKLVETDILTLDAAQEVLEAALNAIGPDMATPYGQAAAEEIASLLNGPYAKDR